MSTAFIGLGSNVDPHANIERALARLASDYGALTISPGYRSEAVGFDGDAFINLVVALQTRLSAAELLAAMKRIETEFGRQRDAGKFSDRNIDLDLLLFDDLVDDAIGVPHPDIDNYSFVIRPLVDIAPTLIHPRHQKPMQTLLAERPDLLPPLQRLAQL